MLIFVHGIYNTMVNRKSVKLPTAWSSKLPKRYKRNTITSNLHQSKKISMNFADEVKHIKTKFLKADYPLHFMDSIIRNFQSTMDAEELLIIPPSLFEEDKPFILTDNPFDQKNNKSTDFVKKSPPFHKWKILHFNKLEYKES